MECQRCVNGASTILDPASWIISQQCNADNPQWTYRQPWLATILVMISHPAPTMESTHSVNSFCGASERYTAMNCIVLFLWWVLCGQSLQSVVVYNFTNLHLICYRSEIFALSCRVNISEPAVCFTVLLHSAVSRVGLHSFQIPTTMSDSQSLNTSLLEFIICSKNEHVVIRDLSYLTLQIIFEAWWASMNVGSKRPIAWNNSRHVSSWRIYWHCGIEDTGSAGLIFIICHQVLRHPLEHGTSSMGKHLLAKAHIAKLNKLTESEVTELTSSMVNKTALTILKRQRSRRITIVSSQSKIIFDIEFDPYWPKWQTKCYNLAAKDSETFEFHQDTSNRHLMLGVVSAEIPWNGIPNLELRQSYMALRNDLVLPSGTTLSNICQREYALIVDAIKKQLPSQNKVSLPLEGWTSTNIPAIMSVIAYSMDRTWALHEVQLSFDELDLLFFSHFES